MGERLKRSVQLDRNRGDGRVLDGANSNLGSAAMRAKWNPALHGRSALVTGVIHGIEIIAESGRLM
jgi:hypothetical protein